MKKILIFLIFIGIFLNFIYHHVFEQKLFEYTMINVNVDTQGDAHLIEIPKGPTILIDAGYQSQAQKSLVPFLKKKNISTIDYFFISHAHRDHYEGAFEILKSGINIRRIFAHRPPELRNICASDCCCHYSSYLELTQLIPTTDVFVGQIIPLSKDVQIRIVDLWNSGDSTTDINDTSILTKLETNNYSIFFAGDLNAIRSKRLVGNVDLRADILKLPHHGLEGMAVSAFHKTVGADVFLAPCPVIYWESDRAKRSRDIAVEMDVPIFVNGLHGDVFVTGYKDRYEIHASNANAPFFKSKI